MWAFVQSLLAKWALLRLVITSLGSLAWLVPLAFVLKAVGLPMLLLLALLAVPVFLVLALVGVPLMLTIIIGILLLAGLFFMLSLGIAVLKIAIPIILIVWAVRWFTKSGKDRPGESPAT